MIIFLYIKNNMRTVYLKNIQVMWHSRP